MAALLERLAGRYRTQPRNRRLRGRRRRRTRSSRRACRRGGRLRCNGGRFGRRRGRGSGSGRRFRLGFRCGRSLSCGRSAGRGGNRLERRNRLCRGRGLDLGRSLRRCRCSRGGGLGRGRGFGFCGFLRRRLRLEQHAAHEVRDVVGNDAELIFRFENAAQTLVEEGDQLLRSEPNLFCKFKYPNFSGSQSLPFTLQAREFPVRGRPHVPSPYRRAPSPAWSPRRRSVTHWSCLACHCRHNK